MSKQETALTDKKLLKLIGKPTPGTRYNKTGLPPVEKLLEYYKLDCNKVYPFYKVLVSLGWVNSAEGEPAFKSNVRKTRAIVAARQAAAGETQETIEEQTQFASEGQVAILRQQVSQYEKAIKERNIEKCIADRIVENFQDAIDSFPVTKVSLNVTKSPVSAGLKKGKFYNILPVSDVHFGEVVDGKSINGLNNYNTAIAKRRHIELFRRNYEYSSIYGCKELHLFFLGDIFSGNIHAELRETNEKQITECVMDYAAFILGLIKEYAKLYEKIEISCVVGNHARNTDRYQFKNKGKDSYEYILYSMMGMYFNELKLADNVHVNLTDSTVLFAKVGSQIWKLEHGDRYKGGSAFVSPFSTVVRDNFKDKGMFRTEDQDFNAVIMGHWHIGGEMSLQGSNTPVYLNPSLIGPGEYSVHNLHSSYPAESFVFITDGKRVISKSSVNLMDIQHG